jgi:hypothetical protein
MQCQEWHILAGRGDDSIAQWAVLDSCDGRSLSHWKLPGGGDPVAPSLGLRNSYSRRAATHTRLALISWRSKALTPVEVTFSCSRSSAQSRSRTPVLTTYSRLGRAVSADRVT